MTTQVEMHGRHSVHHAPQTGLEKQAVPGNPLKELIRYPVVESGLAPRTEDKISDKFQLTEGQFMRHETMDKFSTPQGFVLVASQRGVLPSTVHHASVSTIHSMTNARDVVTMATSSLPQSLPMGKTLCYLFKPFNKLKTNFRSHPYGDNLDDIRIVYIV